MEESNESKVREDRKQVDECRNVFTKTIKAGKRTYFFDVKCGKNENHFLTITESRKRVGKNGTPVYNKSKIFLFNNKISLPFALVYRTIYAVQVAKCYRLYFYAVSAPVSYPEKVST